MKLFGHPYQELKMSKIIQNSRFLRIFRLSEFHQTLLLSEYFGYSRERSLILFCCHMDIIGFISVNGDIATLYKIICEYDARSDERYQSQPI